MKTSISGGIRTDQSVLARRVLVAAAAVVCLVNAGCAVFNIKTPAANSSVSSPVNTQLLWGENLQPNTFKVVVDSGSPSASDVTNEFTIVPNGSGGVATANLNLTPGSHSILVSGNLWTWYDQKYDFTSSTATFNVQGVPSGISVTAHPNPLTVPSGSNATVTVTVTVTGNVTGPVNTNLAGLGQVTANPVSFNINISGGSGTGASTLSASSSVIAGKSTVTVNATAASGPSASTSFTLNVTPRVTSVTPSAQIRGGSVAISGASFDPTCSNNKVTVAGTTTGVNAAQGCSTTALHFAVPASATAAGLTTIGVTTNAEASNTVPFTVLPTELLLSSSANDFFFAVVDFTSPPPPPAVTANPGFGGGMVLTCSGSTAAVGNKLGGQVVLFDVSNPAAPAQIGQPIATGLSGISAIKLNGKKILVGESAGSRVVLIDITTPTAPAVGPPITTTINSIGSIGFSGAKAVVSGTNNTAMDIMDFTNPANPTQTSFDPGLGGGLKAALDGNLAAAGSPSSSSVKLIDITVPTVVGTANTNLGGIFSIAIKGAQAAAGSSNSFNVEMIDFSSPANPVVSSFNPNIGGGWNVARTATRLAMGNITGSNVLLVDTTGATPALLGNVNSSLGSVGSLCVADF